MKKEDIYLDISKLRGEEIKEVATILINNKEEISVSSIKSTFRILEADKNFNFLSYHHGSKSPFWGEFAMGLFIKDKTEIDLSEFRQLFPDKGEEEKTFTITEFSVGDFGDLGNVIGTIKATSKESAKTLFQKMRKISDSNIAFYSFSEVKTFDTTSKEVLQVENNGWIEVNNSLPLCTSTGDWDGKQSDIILAETITGKKFLAQCYEGFMDGSKFFDWYQVDEINQNDWLINESISRWMKIPF